VSEQRPTLAIGAVLKQLQDEFPDLTLSKVRFLDAQGVVSPQRAGSGYRRYTERDVERLRFVLRAQRDRFWPLKVIREALDAFDRGLEPAPVEGRPSVPAPASDADAPTVADIVAEGDHDLRLSVDELCAATGLDAKAVAGLADFGLVRPGKDGYYDADGLQIARAAAALLAHGIDARHLRPFRLAADREVGLVQQLSFRPGDSDRDAAAEVVRECLALHLALVRAGLRG
jgi:DNA-binding transcriptional MerR regulator